MSQFVPVVFQINISPGGVPKLPIPQARVTRLGLEGDRQRYEEHGGPLRAVCLYSLERIRALQAEGHPIQPGSVGENLTLQGLDWDALVPGVQLQIGFDVVLEITSYTIPCRTIEHAFADRRSSRIAQKLHPGWSRLYARVLHEGLIAVADTVELSGLRYDR